MNTNDAWNLAIERGDDALRRDDRAAAEQAYREAQALAEPDSLPMAESLVRLGRLLEAEGRRRQAEKLFREALRIFESTVGEEYFGLALGRDLLTPHQ